MATDHHLQRPNVLLENHTHMVRPLSRPLKLSTQYAPVQALHSGDYLRVHVQSNLDVPKHIHNNISDI